MADTQLGLYANPMLLEVFGIGWDDNDFAQDSVLFQRAIAVANDRKPGFVVRGDLINRPGHAGQISEFKRIASPTYGAW